MKKLLLILLFTPLFFACGSDDEDKACWEIYIENPDGINCLTNAIQTEYSEMANVPQNMVDKVIQSYLSSMYCDVTESQIIESTEYASEYLEKRYGCSVIHKYRKVEP